MVAWLLYCTWQAKIRSKPALIKQRREASDMLLKTAYVRTNNNQSVWTKYLHYCTHVNVTYKLISCGSVMESCWMLHLLTALKWPTRHDRRSAFCWAAISTCSLLTGPGNLACRTTHCPLTHGRGRCQSKLAASLRSVPCLLLRGLFLKAPLWVTLGATHHQSFCR